MASRAFPSLGALRAVLPRARAMPVVTPLPVRALATSAVLGKPYDGPSAPRGRHPSAHDAQTPSGEEDLAPLQKIFSQSASRSGSSKTLRVSLEKPKFGIERHGPEPLTEDEFEAAFQARPLRGYTVNFTPYTGRTVPVRYGNVQSALRNLNAILKDNNVRRQYRNQEYFEKPTTRRRRIKKERHYRKFAQAVREKVQLVQRERLRKKHFKTHGLVDFFPDA